ncbi:MAG TPA: rRNA maturation RNase YbeY [Gaiellales bacterium]|jgi:probable rRNA maturation factor|nr:rRNA maturation RNase YbeY [Gaiellales bacterium]
MVEVEIENHSGWRVDEPAAAAAVRSALAAEGVQSGEVGVAFVDERRIAELNAEHRGKPSATDVLSFPIDGRALLPEGIPRQLGDLVVCPAVASAEGTPIATLLVHGALHLVGYDHETDDGAMLARQSELLSEVAPVVADPA